MTKKFLITGGAGFIGSAVARRIISDSQNSVIVFDKLTYAGNLTSLRQVSNSSRFTFVRGDICDASAVRAVLSKNKPDYIMHLAAESHVDRSIDGSGVFMQTNVIGTSVLLDATLAYWRTLTGAARDRFRFHHISTDEVFGSLGDNGLFSETTPYAPNSPYSASKAASDHLVRAWRHTYDLPTVMTNCSNNYGPYHFPEKLIPLMILNGLEGKPLPVYGGGQNVRDWLYVDDHVEALLLVIEKGTIGQSYNVGGNNELRNIDVVHAVCDLLDEFVPNKHKASRRELINFVKDRPGHDQRYAIDATKIRSELGWQPQEDFESGLRKTVRWYIENRAWWDQIRSGAYKGERLGVSA